MLRLKRARGFTLIELLVVVAIIGIFSAVALGALGTARDRGKISAIKSNLVSLRTHADLYYASGSATYGSQSFISGAATSCTGGVFSNTTVTNALKATDSANGAGNIVCRANLSYYYAAAALPGGGWWCVDSTGASRQPAGSLPLQAEEAMFVGNRCP